MLQNILINLLLINLIVILVYESGFWDSLDEYISNRIKFYHLPHIFLCSLCQCFWLSILYLIITGQFSLLTIVLALINGHLTKITIPLYKLIENIVLHCIQWFNNMLNL